jgi:hypothetical protein
MRERSARRDRRPQSLPERGKGELPRFSRGFGG